MASTARIDELKKKFDENPRRYFAPLANEFRKSGDIDQAILICEEFLPQQPGHMSGHIVYGQALFEAGRMPESRTVFETALGLDPENLIALRHLGDIAKSQADVVTARSWYVRVLDADPRNEEIQALIASLDAGAGSVLSALDDQLVETSKFAPPAEERPEPAFLRQDPVPAAEAPPAPAVPSFDLSLIDTQPLGMPSVPAPVAAADTHAPAAPMADLLDGFSVHGFDGTARETPRDTHAHDQTEGLESTAFEPPTENIPEAADLDSSLESGIPSFSAPEAPVAAVAGLQGSGGMDVDEPESIPQHILDAAFTPGFPAVELDSALVLPPQGDPLAPRAGHEVPSAEAARSASSDAELLDFEMPLPADPEVAEPVADEAVGNEPVVAEAVVEEPVAEEPAAEEPVAEEPIAAQADVQPVVEAEAAQGESVPHVPTEEPADIAVGEPEAIETPADAVPTEPVEIAALAPDEIAALASDDLPVAEESSSHDEHHVEPTHEAQEAASPVASAPFVTETMAELYVAQGFREQALSVYNQLLSANPSDERLQGLVAGLSAPPATDAGPTVREFFARIASRRPASASEPIAPPSYDDFVDAPAAEPEPVGVAIDSMATPITVPAQGPEGSIDALFGNRSPGMAEDSAAAALAQAFGTKPEAVPAIVGKPARAADGELSLDSVFRDSPARQPRTSQSFSFDQFFSGQAGAATRPSGPAPTRTSSELPMPGDPPAERNADDIEQFNNWLQGLKQR